MDYKAVLQEQIRGLQKLQDSIKNNPGYAEASCEVAKTILLLCKEAVNPDNRW